jgi:hypothetical protein
VKALLLGALITTLLFAVVNWHNCWFFRHKPRDLVVFLYPLGWLVLFFVLRIRWRLLLVIITLPVAVILIGTKGGMIERNSVAEYEAVQALHQIQSSLNGRGAKHDPGEYPESLPVVTISQPAQKFYRFEYLPNRSADGKILRYLVQATPARRDCEFNRSFTIATDGRIFWTLESRAAKPLDNLLSE